MFYKPMYDMLADKWYIKTLNEKNGANCFESEAEAQAVIDLYKNNPL